MKVFVCFIDSVRWDFHNNSTIIAFSGRFCEQDRNGCSEVECFEGVECMDVPAPGIGVECGVCPLGYTGDGLKCYGITVTDYHADHTHYYQLFLLDIDECLSASTCEQICTNTDGSFVCDCLAGYRLAEDTGNCEGMSLSMM